MCNTNKDIPPLIVGADLNQLFPNWTQLDEDEFSVLVVIIILSLKG